MLVKVINNLFVGLMFMLVATCCHFFIHSGPIYIVADVIGILLIIGSIIIKYKIDKSYKRSLTELATGTY